MKNVRGMIGAMLTLAIAACFGCAARAADSEKLAEATLPVLDLIPEDALAVVVVNHLDKADEQVGKVTSETQLPNPGLLQLVKMQTGIREGLDEKGSAALALLPGANDKGGPVAIKFIPVSDYKKFIGQLKPVDPTAEIVEVTFIGHRALVGHKGNFAVIADKPDEDSLKKALASTKSIVPVIGTLREWAGEQTMSFVASPAGVKRGISMARTVVTQMKAVLGNSSDPSMKMAAGNLEVYDQLLNSADKEVSAFGAGFSVDHDGGLHIHSRLTFVAGGSWAAAASAPEAPPGVRFACLPGGTFMLAFDGVMPKSFSKGMLNMSVDMINTMSKAEGGKELSKDQSKQLNDLMEKTMTGIRSMSIVMAPPKPGGSLYSNMAAVMKVDNSRRFIAGYQDSVQKMRDVLTATGVQFPFIQDVKKTKIGDDDGLELTMDMAEMFKKMPKNPASTKMLEMMIGPGGKMTAYIVPIDDTTVAFSYINSDNIARIKAACKNPQGSLANDAHIEQTAKLLPPSAQWVGYLSPKGLTDFVGGMVSAMVPAGAKAAIPEFPKTPPIGFAAEQSTKGLDVTIVVPGDAIKALGTYIKNASAPKTRPTPQAPTSQP